MNQIVSKSREKMTRSREKLAGKAALPTLPWRDRLGTRLAVGVLIWLFAVALMGADRFLQTPIELNVALIWVGQAALLLACLFVCVCGLEIARPGALSQTSQVLLLGLVVLVALIPVKFVLYVSGQTHIFPEGVAPFLCPFPLAPILATLLFGGAAGLVVGLLVSFTASIFSDASLPVLLSGLVATAASATMAYRARTRAQVMRTGLAAGLAQISCVFALTALTATRSDASTVFNQAGACIASGFLAGVLALLILPLFESIFRITSDITLLELTDLGHPLLQKLALEAPGTYHHSLVVANLAQAAADEIGANSLQARVCAYFHDIGKLCKPDFFTENIRIDLNPHDRLPPSMSTLVITSHVKEGISLARLYKLPQSVINVIQEHHGTSLISYFHDKAKAQQESERAAGSSPGPESSDVPEWNFRYGGPRPSGPESAIISLADPVEAASRSLPKASPGSIQDLVDEIVGVRLRDGQLDESQLTLNQLSAIKKSFVFTLSNMLHARTPYPKDEDRDKQPTKSTPAGPPEVGLPDDAFHG